MLDKVVSNRIVDNIIILDQDHENISVGLNKVLIKAIQNGVDVQTYLNLYEDLTEALPLNLAGRQFYTIFPISRHNSNYFYQLWNRVLDILSSVFGLFITILIIPFIFVINLFVNRGPLFYSQLRVGQGGDEFKITKFRSMVINAEESGAKMATKGDARITKFGGFMRKTRIDELPQFWAVLSGYMSLIGPRPERKVFVDQLSEKIPFYNARHLVKPGITGWAQVKYPYGENLEDSYNKLEYDLYYIKNRSVTIDIRIVLKTISTIIFSKGQ
ncbi:MAG: sugar transferase [Flavobacteriales bacterium]|nr:sugar transferase [Flavobacteriales bacterium]